MFTAQTITQEIKQCTYLHALTSLQYMALMVFVLKEDDRAIYI